MPDFALESLSNRDLLDAWKSGNEAAAGVLVRRYHIRLTALVQARLGKRLGRRLDAEDVVLSAWRSAFLGFDRGMIAVPPDDDLWPFLATVTMRKLARQASRHSAGRRDMRNESAFEPGRFVEDVASKEPEPPALIMATDLMASALSEFSSQEQRIIEGLFQGEKQSELARTFGYSERTIRRLLTRFRKSLAGKDADAIVGVPGQQPAVPPNASSPGESWPSELVAVDYTDLKLHQLTGQGNFGKVYMATWLTQGTPVAVKFLRKKFWRNQQCVESLKNEVTRVHSLRHPGFVRVHGFGVTPHGGTLIVTDWIDGENLFQWKASSQPSLGEVGRCGLRIAEALREVHEAGLIHGDITPGNVLMRKDGSPVLVDFGFARAISDVSDLRLGGTPGFLAPEQVSSAFGPISPKTDVYGFGSLLYYLLTGGPPSQGGSIPETLREVVSDASPELSAIPSPLQDLIGRCLLKPQTARPASIPEVAAELQSRGRLG
ncbi:protein kinase domain-containing protein [Rubinisphaera margarita]|uniref:protein kinase domain-containing protein n=1 Tax=Rubinisphaera margarita TaxID=2909586 RepID=UPI001EE86C0E|nr:protein kinase [Rubinisphaera margarita]MCG6156529.1 protein kinase [Rubinisphaera margarita]